MGTPGLFVSEGSSPPPPRHDPGQKEDDELSINSSLASQHDSDEEWSVETIHYETFDDGRNFYLVEWTGYPLEEATWEPEENVSGELLEEWRAKQQKIARGEEEIFNVAAWQEFVEKRAEERRKRHRERNFERKRRGLELSLWEGESKEEYYSSDEEVAQDDFNDILPPPKPTGRQIDAIPSIEDQPKQPLGQSTAGKTAQPRKRASSGEKSKSPTKSKSPALAVPPRLQPKSAASTSTGYQGTARRPTVVKPANKPNTTRTTLASKFSRPTRTAKKTQTGARTMVKSTGNVFTSGKPIRTRARLNDNAADTSQTPRTFSNHRLKRKAELQGRDKADQAPATLPTTLFSISSGPPATASSTHCPPATGSPAAGSPATASPVADSPGKGLPLAGSTSATPGPRSVLKHSIDTLTTRSASNSSVAAPEGTGSTLQRPLPKKRKSVQFVFDDPFVEEPEAMDVDDQSQDRWQRPRAPTPPPSSRENDDIRKPQPILRKLSIQQYQHKAVGRNVDMSIVMGGSKAVEVTFESVKNESEQWHSHFINQTVLHFARNCHGPTFAKQRDAVVERVLCHGSLKAKSSTDEYAMECAAGRLLLGSFGAAYFHDEFSIIIYAGACEAWKSVFTEVDASSPSLATLKYVIYKPSPVATKPLPERKATASKLADGRGPIFQDLLRIDYHSLMPPGLKDTRHNFYLAFPPSRKQLLDAISEWLHLQNPHCKVFSTKTAGDWRAFTNPKIVETGVIIVHETSTESLRQFPELLRLLSSKNSSAWLFWCIGESLQKHPLFPSIRSFHDTATPGSFELTRLFPHGNAVLLTPSFLIAEPLRAFQLLNWYKRMQRKPASPKIVAAAGLSQFLRDLAIDKADQRKRLLARGGNEDEARKEKLSQVDCMTRFDTSATVDSMQMSFMDCLLPDEQLAPIIYADACIDANDEQSLVNWFGCWTQTRLDQFRKFSVLGTEGSTEIRQTIKYEDLPRYTPGTERDHAAEIDFGSKPETADGGPKTADMVLPGGTKKLVGTSAIQIRDFLFPLARTIANTNPVIFPSLFANPVSYYRDIEATADAMGDFRREMATYQQWLRFTWPFFARYNPPHIPDNIPRGNAPHIYNCYFAFFYTPQGYVASENKWQGRRPWAAVYRPEHPHERPWESTELIIWDCATSDRFAGEREILLSQLNEAQQQLIEFVEDHGQEKNAKLPLNRVWLGGFLPTAETLPFDATMEALEAMVKKPLENVPVSDTELLAKGFRPVILPTHVTPSTSSPDNMSIDLADDLFADEDDLDSKIIFHPPRSPRPIHKSRCENLLFKWVKQTRKGSSHSVLTYSFTPTTEWYKRQQVAENRNFEHIYVGPWPRVWEMLRVPHGTPMTSQEEREKSRNT
ncbi:chromo domain-containing protein [Colletotrichum karsti]|uniref:Chromo domain-containing protein n=1 Tax=Colletotrichum karsti TaxID=1095194 RepID=A0A9P6I8Y7_9PEZI|nr:chromo domain-containing protein [Colletotrichum karsti]KAF9878538.1 chromo domain-containing protein [Colletotrichum karsti]